MGPPRCIEKKMGHFCLADVACTVIKSQRSLQQTLCFVQVCVVLCYSLGPFLLKSKTRHSRGFPLPLCRGRVLVARSVAENGLALRYSKVRSRTM